MPSSKSAEQAHDTWGGNAGQWAILQTYAEAQLRAEIVEPLLRKMGFTNVTESHSGTEYGRDFVANLPAPFGRMYLCVIQVKKTRLNAKATSSKSIGYVVTQLKQAMAESVVDPSTLTKRIPDKCFFITPYPIPNAAREAFANTLVVHGAAGVEVIDGVRLLEEALRHIPDAFSAHSIEASYRARVVRDANIVTESPLAYGLHSPLELDTAYVDISLDYLPILAALRRGLFPQRLGPVTDKDIALVQRHCKQQCIPIAGGLVEALPCPPQDEIKPRTQMRVGGRPTRPAGPVEHYLRLTDIYEHYTRRLAQYATQLERIAGAETNDNVIDECISSGIGLGDDVNAFVSLAPIRRLWPSARHPVSLRDEEQPADTISANVLFRVRRNLFVLGGPGSGKTTFLRRYAQERGRRAGPLPVFVPLATVREPDVGGLLRAMRSCMQLHGYPPSVLSKKADGVGTLLEAGGLCVLFDGLDEAAHRAGHMQGAIARLSKKYPKCQVIVSSRDCFDELYWPGALVVEMRLFTPQQLNSFVARWYPAEPSARREIGTWIENNRSMADLARTPLLAGLICSLYQSRAELPATERELYQQRFDLLLGKWERAKGIRPLPASVRSKYWHYLLNLALAMHNDGARSESLRIATTMAKRFYSRSYHSGPEDLVSDCIGRGILKLVGAASVSFGHLTYQEFMAGEYLAEHNPLSFVWSRVGDPWWAKALMFYCSRKLDIGELLRKGLQMQSVHVRRRDIMDLARVASLTDEKLVIEVCAAHRI